MNNHNLQTLENKLNKINNNFPKEDYSVSRLLLPIMFPEKFKTNFNEKEAQEIGKRVKTRISLNLQTTIIPRLEYILALTGGRYINLVNQENLISTEFDLLKKLTTKPYGKYNLSSRTINEIKKVKETKEFHYNGYSNEKIKLYFHNKNELFEFDKPPIEYIMFGKKTEKSIILKILDRVSKLEIMSSEDIEDINKFRNKKKITTNHNIPLSKEKINKYAWNFLVKSFKSKTSFHDYFHNNAIKNEIGGNLYEIIGDLFLIDGARGKIIVKDNSIKYLDGIIRSMENVEMIKSRCDDFYKDKIKDKAIVYALKGGKNNRNYSELRLQTIKENLEGEFGEVAHFRYKREKLNELKKSIKKNKKLDKAAKNLCISLNVNYNFLFD